MAIDRESEIRNGTGFAYWDKTRKIYCMVRCLKCGRENWSLAVAAGHCCWCGYNPNVKDLNGE